MSLRKMSVLLMVGAVLGVAACSDDDPEGPTVERFTATLNGTNESPDVTTTATGTGEVTFMATGPITYTLSIANIPAGRNVTLAHIHGPAAVEVNAGVILNLNPQLSPPVTNGVLAAGSTSTTGTAVSLDSLKVLIRNGNAYMNVHTNINGSGEIRGQLVPG